MIYRSEGDAATATRRRQVFMGVSGVATIAILIAFQSVMRPFVLGALLAYVLHPVVERMTRLRVKNRAVPRWVAIVILYVGLVASLVFGIIAVTPRVVSEVRDFAIHEVPELRGRAEHTWLPKVRSWAGRLQGVLGAHDTATTSEQENHEDNNDVRALPVAGGGWRIVIPPEGVHLERVNDNRYRLVAAPTQSDEDTGGIAQKLRALGAGHVADIVRVGGGIIGGVIGGIFGFFMTMMVSAYMLVTHEQIRGFGRSLVPPGKRDGWDALLQRLDEGLKGVVRGQLIICLVNGVLSAVGFALAGLKYWPTLALVACVLSLIPIFGSILSSIPAVAIGLTQSFGTALFVLLWILGIHQLEANLLNPKIMGSAAKIHPVLVVFSLLAGEHFFGILGALLAVPVMSIVQSVFLHWRNYALDWPEDQTVESQKTE
jgi:predicted PurR-regulated permease PerM